MISSINDDLSLGLKLIAKSIIAARLIVSTYVPAAGSDIDAIWAVLFDSYVCSKERYR